MQLIGPGLRDHADLSAGSFAIFGRIGIADHMNSRTAQIGITRVRLRHCGMTPFSVNSMWSAITYSAEYGKRAGGQVSVVTQSGSNQLHGAGLSSYGTAPWTRGTSLTARPNRQSRGLPPFRRNQFGGSLGGPIKQDKMFLFGNYEGFRHSLGLSNIAFVPDNGCAPGLAALRRDLYRCADRTANCANLNAPVRVPNLDSRMLRFMRLWPESNGPAVVANAWPPESLRTSNNPVQTIREDFGTARFDMNISIKTRSAQRLL